MKKLTLIAGLITLIVYSCQKEITHEEETVQILNQAKTVCGTTEAMEKMDPAMKAQLMSSTFQNEVVVSHIVFYLDFDGAVISPGFGSHDRSPLTFQVRNCPPAPLSAAQKAEVLELVSDDFSPFNITVTDDESVFLAASPAYRHLCVVTTNPSVMNMSPNTGGVSPFNCNRIFNSPCFVFAQGYVSSLKLLGSVISHEMGHTMGLDHQSLYAESCVHQTEYHPGFGTGILSFSPIMGAGSNLGINNWFSHGCYHNQCRPTGQDDFGIISSSVEIKTDDFPNDLTGNNTLIAGPINGTLERQNDVDYIRINFQGPGSVNIRANNIDIKASLVTPGGHVLAVYNDPLSTDVVIPVAQGMAYLKIEGASNENMSSQFMTGKYKVEF